MSLKGKVHKPLMISVDMTDRQYAQQVEACTSLAQRSVSGKCYVRRLCSLSYQTFVCENREDYNQLVALNKHFHGKKTSKNKEGKVSLFLQLITPTNENINAASPCSIEHVGNQTGRDRILADSPTAQFLRSGQLLYQPGSGRAWYESLPQRGVRLQPFGK